MTDIYKYNMLISPRTRAMNFQTKNVVYVNNIIKNDVLIISDSFGNNRIEKVQHEIEANIFKKELEKVQDALALAKEESIREYLRKKQTDIRAKLHKARTVYVLQNFPEACNMYRDALTEITTNESPDEFLLGKYDIFAIKYALVLSNLGAATRGSLTTACEILQSLINNSLHVPRLYYTLALVQLKLYQQNIAKELLRITLAKLDEPLDLIEINWPVSDDVMINTDKKGLEVLVHEKLSEHIYNIIPDVYCSYINCTDKEIFFDSPKFDGYTQFKCSENCSWCYHRHCYKLHSRLNQKHNEDFLCRTPDCAGKIVSMSHISDNLKVKHNKTFTDKTRAKQEVQKSSLPVEEKKLPEVNATQDKPALEESVNKSLPVEENKIKSVPVEENKVKSVPVEENKAKPVPEVKKIESTSTPAPNKNTFLNTEVKSLRKTPDSSTSSPVDKVKSIVYTPRQNLFAEFLQESATPETDSVDDFSYVPVVKDKQRERCNSVASWASSSFNCTDTTNIDEEEYNSDISSFSSETHTRRPASSLIKRQHSLRDPTYSSPPGLKRGVQDRLRKSTDELQNGCTKKPSTKYVPKLDQAKEVQTDTIVSISRFTQMHPTVKEMSTQTDDWNGNKELKNLVVFIQDELYKGEYKYNELMSKYSQLKNSVNNNDYNVSTPIPDNLNRFLEEKNLTTDETTSFFFLKRFEMMQAENNSLRQEVSRMKGQNEHLSSELKHYEDTMVFERKQYQSYQTQYGNDINQLKNQAEYLCQIVRSYSQTLQPELYRQINFSKIVYKSFIDTLECKCRTMIFHLKQIKEIASTNTCPSLMEFENNFRTWNNTLMQVLQWRNKSEIYFATAQNQVHNYFENLSAHIDNQLTVDLPPQIITEPANILMEQFKTVFIANRNYENILDNQLKFDNTLPRKTVPIPPGFDKLPMHKIEERIEFIPPAPPVVQTKSRLITVNTSEATAPALNKPPPSNCAVNVTKKSSGMMADLLHGKMGAVPYKSVAGTTSILNKSQSDANIMKIKPSATISATSNQSKGTISTPNTVGTAPNQSKATITTVANSISTVTSTASIIPSTTTTAGANKSTGAIPKSNLIDEFFKNPYTKAKLANAKENANDVRGITALVDKLEKSFPLISRQTLHGALEIIRKEKGMLTGMDKIELSAEVRKILPEYQPKKTDTTKDTNPAWASIPKKKTWENSDPDIQCSICFELMTSENSIQLTCKHYFHNKCIRKWHSKNSICPICRVFFTLDNDYPPLA